MHVFQRDEQLIPLALQWDFREGSVDKQGETDPGALLGKDGRKKNPGLWVRQTHAPSQSQHEAAVNLEQAI